jgi:hypothetical protein
MAGKKTAPEAPSGGEQPAGSSGAAADSAALEDPRPMYLARNIHFGLHFLHQRQTDTSSLSKRIQHWILKAASRREQ